MIYRICVFNNRTVSSKTELWLSNQNCDFIRLSVTFIYAKHPNYVNPTPRNYNISSSAQNDELGRLMEEEEEELLTTSYLLHVVSVEKSYIV